MKFNRVAVAVAVALTGAAGVANAGSLAWVQEATDTLSVATLANPVAGFNVGALALTPGNALPGLVGPGAGAAISLGYLKANSTTGVTFTYLGADAGHDDGVTNAALTVGTYIGNAGTNSIELRNKVHNIADPNTVVGVKGFTSVHTVATVVNPLALNAVPFSFADQSTVPTTEAVNGNPATWSPFATPFSTIGLIGTNMVVNGVKYLYVLGFNDKGGGCNLAKCTTQADWNDFVVGVNAVPEPEVYAMLAAGLGLMGFVARRRKQLNGAA